MSIARKLWLGFGALLLIFLLTSLVIVLSERSTQETLDEIINVEEPTRAASFEMEINTVEISRDVLDYLETGDERFRERFADDREDFERSKARYDELVDTPTGVDQGEMISSVYERYVVLGADLLDASDEQDDLLDRTNRGFEAIDSIADETIEAEVDNAGGETGTTEELGRLADIQYDIAAMNTSLASYLREPGDEPRQRVLDDEAEVREGFEAYGNLDLDESERERIRTLEERFDATTTEVNGLLESGETLRENAREFAETQIELDDILDEEVQPWTAQQLTEAEEAANDSIRGVYVTILMLLIAGLLAGALASSIIGRNILGSVRRLKSGADRVGGGDFEHRIEPYTDDELGSVAVAFNEMLDKRQEANLALLESEERFRGLSEATFEGVVISEKGKVLESNRAFAEMFGYETGEVVGKNTLDFTLPIYHDLIQRNSLSNHEEPYEVEGLRKDGSTFDIELRGKSSSYLDRIVYITAVRNITARKEAEEALHKSEARTSAIVDTATDAIITMTTDGLIRSFNPGAQRTFGYSEQEAVGQPLRMLMPERFQEPHEAGFRRYLGDGEAHVVGKGAVELAGLRKGGEEFPLELSLGEMRENEDVLFTGIIRDVTDRKEAERGLREAEERFRGAFDSAAIGMALNDVDGRFLQVNGALCEMLGRSEEELLASTFGDITHPDDVNASVDYVRRLLDGEVDGYQLEKRYLHAGGHPVWVSLGVSVVKDTEDRPLYLIAQMQDITERRETEEARSRLVSIVESSEDAIISGTLDGIVGTWNSGAEKLYGYSAEEMIGRSASVVIPPNQRHELLEYMERVGRGESVNIEETERISKAGESVWVSVRLSSIRDSENNVTGASMIARDITERRQIEEAMRESEERYRAVVEQSTEAIWVFDPETKQVLESNTSFQQMLGYTAEELQHLTNYDFVAHSRENVDASVERIVRNRRGFFGKRSGERKYRCKDGALLDVEASGTVIPYQGKEAVCGVVRDMSEIKQAEEEIRQLNDSLEQRVEERTARLVEAFEELRENEQRLRESEERYSLVVAGSNDGIWDWDMRNNEIFWNDRLLEIVGLSRSEFGGTFEAFSELLHPDDVRRTNEAITAHLERDEEYNIEFRLRRPTGEYRICRVRGEAQQDNDGEAIRMAGVVRDITERKWAEESLRLRDRAISASSNGIVISDPSQPDNPLIYVNPAFELMTGYSAEEVLGSNCRFLQGSDRDQPSIEALRAAIREERECTVVLRNYRKDGTLFWNELSVSPVRDESGRLTHFVGVQNDITQRKRVEEEIRRLNESLEERGEERTVQLESTVHDLDDARVAAEGANRAKSDFLANMSHEIRTPMNGVIGMTELLMDTPLSPEQREFAQTVKSSGENLLTIINDILDFSKIEAGKMRIETIDFDLRSTVEDVVGLLAERAHGEGLELASLIEYDVPTALRGDPGRIRQILTNLLGNAIKFTESGEVVLKVELVDEGILERVRWRLARRRWFVLRSQTPA